MTRVTRRPWGRPFHGESFIRMVDGVLVEVGLIDYNLKLYRAIGPRTREVDGQWCVVFPLEAEWNVIRGLTRWIEIVPDPPLPPVAPSMFRASVSRIARAGWREQYRLSNYFVIPMSEFEEVP